jgi:predicted nuclease of predicted toxin-antitoxin system
MRFLVDQQLPPALSRWLADAGHDSVHVSMIGFDAADDAAVWSWAQRENRIVVSKDEDFLFLANRPKEAGRLLWVRLRNCRRETLLAAFNQALDSALAAFADGQRVVEIG